MLLAISLSESVRDHQQLKLEQWEKILEEAMVEICRDVSAVWMPNASKRDAAHSNRKEFSNLGPWPGLCDIGYYFRQVP